MAGVQRKGGGAGFSRSVVACRRALFSDVCLQARSLPTTGAARFGPPGGLVAGDTIFSCGSSRQTLAVVEAWRRVARRGCRLAGDSRVTRIVGNARKGTALMRLATFSRRARNSGADCLVLPLAVYAPLGRPGLVGSFTVVSLFPRVVSGAGPSGTSICLAERGLAPRLQQSLSLVAGSHQLGGIAASVCPRPRGQDWIRRAGRLHQSFCRERTSDRVCSRRAGADDRGTVALGDTAAAFADRVLFGLG